MHLAQLNFARLREHIDHPASAEFKNNVERMNALAARTAGFVWRLADEEDLPENKFSNDPHVIYTLSVWENAAASADSPFRALETKELGQRIQKALDGLSPEYRLLLLLVADEELSYEEIAALVEQSTDAVRGKLHRARKTFAALFEQTE